MRLIKVSNHVEFSECVPLWSKTLWMCAMTHMAYYRDRVLCSLLVLCVLGNNAYQACSLCTEAGLPIYWPAGCSCNWKWWSAIAHLHKVRETVGESSGRLGELPQSGCRELQSTASHQTRRVELHSIVTCQNQWVATGKCPFPHTRTSQTLSGVDWKSSLRIQGAGGHMESMFQTTMKS